METCFNRKWMSETTEAECQRGKEKIEKAEHEEKSK